MHHYVNNQRNSWIIWLISIALFIIPCSGIDVSALLLPNIVQFFVTPLSGILLTLLFCKSLQKQAMKIQLDNIGRNSLHIYGLHFPLIHIAWLLSIPLVMHMLSLFNIMVSGEDVKNMIPIQWLLAIFVTYISHQLGLQITKAKR